MSALTKLTPPLSGIGFAPHVQVMETRFLRKDEILFIEGVAHVGSFEFFRLMIDWVNAHRVLTSPDTWLTDDGQLVDQMPTPMGPLP